MALREPPIYWLDEQYGPISQDVLDTILERNELRKRTPNILRDEPSLSHNMLNTPWARLRSRKENL